MSDFKCGVRRCDICGGPISSENELQHLHMEDTPSYTPSYIRLRAENARLKAKLESHAPDGHNVTNEQYAKVVAENERLKKTGTTVSQDAMYVYNRIVNLEKELAEAKKDSCFAQSYAKVVTVENERLGKHQHGYWGPHGAWVDAEVIVAKYREIVKAAKAGDEAAAHQREILDWLDHDMFVEVFDLDDDNPPNRECDELNAKPLTYCLTCGSTTEMLSEGFTVCPSCQDIITTWEKAVANHDDAIITMLARLMTYRRNAEGGA